MFDPDGPVLGIDPGLSRCGYGVVRGRGPAMASQAYGVLRTPPRDPLPERLAQLEADLEALMADVRPRALAVERVLFQANVRSAMTVGQASGLALAVAARGAVPVTHYSPNEVKRAVTGDGGADKTQVQVMVARLLGLSDVPRPADAADALALACAHAWAAPLMAAIGDARGDESGDVAGPQPAPKLQQAVAAALARDATGARR